MSQASELLTEIQRKIHNEIPASKLLGFEIQKVSVGSAQTLLRLHPNTNHLGTFFGGSLYVQGALSCYAALLGLLRSHKILTNNIVIAHGDIDYLKPGIDDCVGHVAMTENKKEKVIDDLRSPQARAWVELEAELKSQHTLVARIRGRYLVRLD
jgi:thioesterase domain-containing protein